MVPSLLLWRPEAEPLRDGGLTDMCLAGSVNQFRVPWLSAALARHCRLVNVRAILTIYALRSSPADRIIFNRGAGINTVSFYRFGLAEGRVSYALQIPSAYCRWNIAGERSSPGSRNAQTVGDLARRVPRAGGRDAWSERGRQTASCVKHRNTCKVERDWFSEQGERS